MDKKLEDRIARLEKMLSKSSTKPTLEQRIERLEKLVKEARAPRNIGNAMVDAISNRDTDRALQMIENGADPNCKNKYGMSALAAAVNYHNIKVAKALLEAGADPNEVMNMTGADWYGNNKDVDMQISLLDLADFNDNAMASLLKQYGAR